MAFTSPSIIDFATELLDLICSFIHSPCDLLSFALCSRRLSAIIIPYHIQYRDLVCSPWHRDLFAKLLEHPLRSSQFVSLSLELKKPSVDWQAKYIWPKSLVEDLGRVWPMVDGGIDRAFDDVSKAIASSLVGLTSFRCDLHNSMLEHIFTALQGSCPKLSTLELVHSTYSVLNLQKSKVSQSAWACKWSCASCSIFFLSYGTFRISLAFRARSRCFLEMHT
jgi:hypothetical protein